jgi:hypothetical protein
MLVVLMVLLMVLYIGFISLSCLMIEQKKSINNVSNQVNYRMDNYGADFNIQLSQVNQKIYNRLNKLENLIGEYYYQGKWNKLYKGDIIETHGDSTKIRIITDYIGFTTKFIRQYDEHADIWVSNGHIIKYSDLLKPIKEIITNNVVDNSEITVKELAKKHNITVTQIYDIIDAYEGK